MNETVHAAEPASWGPRRLRTYVGLAIGLAPLVLGVIVGSYYIYDHTPRWGYWAAGMIACWLVDACYFLAVAAACVGLPMAVRVLRRRPTGRSRWFRIAALSGVVLLGALVMEIASRVILAVQAYESVMPAGDLNALAVERKVSRSLPDDRGVVKLPTEFPPDDGRTSIAVVGESSAEGVPFDRWLSMGRVVASELSRAIPGRRFEAETVAQAGDTLEAQHRKLRDLRFHPDVLIVYCGHNEFAARIPLRRDRAYYIDDGAPSVASRAMAKALSWSSFHVLMQRNIEKCRIAIPPPAFGRRALVDAPAFLPSERAQLLADFRRRLDAIADYAAEVGSILVLISPSANDSDYDPNRSYLPPESPRAERRAFETAYLAVKEREATNPSAAIEAYRELLARAPGFAAAHWRLARLLAAQGDVEGAYHHAVVARDLDGYPQRCPTDFQEVYGEVARRHPGSIYINGQAYFHALSPNGLLDDRLFHDAMHPSFRGQMALAQAVLRGLYERRAFGWAADAPAPVVDPEEIARRFGVDADAWREVCWWGMMSYQITGPAAFDRGVRNAKEQAFQRAAVRMGAGVLPEQAGLASIGRLEPIPIVPYGDPDASARSNLDRHDGRAAETVVGASREEQKPQGEINTQQ
ncbi:tetratricopeptide repeat protein [Paludisphaera rhizosphaerae]|uniref:tetratricopeptide repeat protein n=1 Tax=Paludisphaera rhizosphaerae TaxID=2711216 RepID=UPI0013ED5DF5|nr:tetratricopeptide repeat protein [Paludisphaera rhizosphaerae]